MGAAEVRPDDRLAESVKVLSSRATSKSPKPPLLPNLPVLDPHDAAAHPRPELPAPTPSHGAVGTQRLHSATPTPTAALSPTPHPSQLCVLQIQLAESPKNGWKRCRL
ncbi:hypothetical protein P154DRAFT_571290 [Amniculicola lignicola CBS 123094]|uniref:Uncharacterized protein n=1 Tax=Amniculicola lignicola CBS 123094 TaxID=1392246 RepID=A0A6A5WTD4_9PLEO|nr:hypothetical protein P154DRAFT_571290 [Amniculicola lignicola CBS 123094]